MNMQYDFITKQALAAKAAGNWENWTHRCYLPLRVGEVLAIVGGGNTGARSVGILLEWDELVPVADDLRHAVLCLVRVGDMICLRLDRGLVVAVDFLDGRSPLVSTRLRSAAERERDEARAIELVGNGG